MTDGVFSSYFEGSKSAFMSSMSLKKEGNNKTEKFGTKKIQRYEWEKQQNRETLSGTQ